MGAQRGLEAVDIHAAVEKGMMVCESIVCFKDATGN